MTAATSSLVEGLTAVFYVWKIKIDICSACFSVFLCDPVYFSN